MSGCYSLSTPLSGAIKPLRLHMTEMQPEASLDGSRVFPLAAAQARERQTGSKSHWS